MHQTGQIAHARINSLVLEVNGQGGIELWSHKFRLLFLNCCATQNCHIKMAIFNVYPAITIFYDFANCYGK